MVGIIVVDLVLLALFLAAGAMADCIGVALFAWVFIAAIATFCIGNALWEINTPGGRQRSRAEQERERKEWLAWRYAVEERKQREKKAARKSAAQKKR